nr:MAG TPA: hypothetical protein [Caudoviricetes sp.]
MTTFAPMMIISVIIALKPSGVAFTALRTVFLHKMVRFCCASNLNSGTNCRIST